MREAGRAGAGIAVAAGEVFSYRVIRKADLEPATVAQMKADLIRDPDKPAVQRLRWICKQRTQLPNLGKRHGNSPSRRFPAIFLSRLIARPPFGQKHPLGERLVLGNGILIHAGHARAGRPARRLSIYFQSADRNAPASLMRFMTERSSIFWRVFG